MKNLFVVQTLFKIFFVLAGLAGCQNFDSEASITGLYTGPFFDPLSETNLTAHMGSQAVLPCLVRQLGDKSVSWVRVRDKDILTVDSYTFIGDERFESAYSASTETWNLFIKYVQERDAGFYECQVSTEPKMSLLFNLRVVVPKVSINPPEDRYVKAGSFLRIECEIVDVVQMPDYIFWYHDGMRIMDLKEPNIMVSVERVGPEALSSFLTIKQVRSEDSGNYTCMPSNLDGVSVSLHVLNEKNPAAMQDGRNGSRDFHPHLGVFLFLLSLPFFAFTFLDSLHNLANETETDSVTDDCIGTPSGASGHFSLSGGVERSGPRVFRR